MNCNYTTKDHYLNVNNFLPEYTIHLRTPFIMDNVYVIVLINKIALKIAQ